MDSVFLISGFSSFIAEMVTLPICTVKTVYQNKASFTTRECIRYIYKNAGYGGFFQASYPAILSQMISTSSKFSVYHSMKKWRETDEKDIVNNSLNGMIGGIVGSFITHPIDVWKNYRQRNEDYFGKLNETWKQSSRTMFVKKMIYPGYSGSLLKNIILYSALFPINDYYKSLYQSIWISAPLTTLTISLFIQPFDYYKNVKMAGNPANQFFRGFHLMIARSIPHFAITMFCTHELLELRESVKKVIT